MLLNQSTARRRESRTRRVVNDSDKKKQERTSEGVGSGDQIKERKDSREVFSQLQVEVRGMHDHRFSCSTMESF